MSKIKTFKDWHGNLPKSCDLCKGKITDTFIDGKTDFGPWAIMGPAFFKYHGVGLGLGKGQKYVKEASNV